jgi:hypothetical protein
LSAIALILYSQLWDDRNRRRIGPTSAMWAKVDRIATLFSVY